MRTREQIIEQGIFAGLFVSRSEAQRLTCTSGGRVRLDKALDDVAAGETLVEISNSDDQKFEIASKLRSLLEQIDRFMTSIPMELEEYKLIGLVTKKLEEAEEILEL